MSSSTSRQRLETLRDSGVSIWLDTLSRELLRTGAFATLISDYLVTGATSNPTIFAKAIGGSSLYDEQLRRLAQAGQQDLRELFFAIALDDVREAALLLRPAYDASGGRDGFVSFECTPDLAHDAEATIAQATELWQRLAMPNVMIKVPGTRAGLVAIEELTRLGVNVNVTLLFSVERYEQVIDAYLRGLSERVKGNQPLNDVSSAASFFLSRIDTIADQQLPADSPLRGRIAIASAQSAYGCYRARFSGPDWERLARLGAGPQRPLWASTGTKSPAHSDTMYVSELAGADVINTMPEQTLRAFADHGVVGPTLDDEPADAARVLAEAADAGINLTNVADRLERDGVESFCASYHELLARIEASVQTAGADAVSAFTT